MHSRLIPAIVLVCVLAPASLSQIASTTYTETYQNITATITVSDYVILTTVRIESAYWMGVIYLGSGGAVVASDVFSFRPIPINGITHWVFPRFGDTWADAAAGAGIWYGWTQP